MRKNKSKFLAFILSFVPGLAHIYLGLFERGAIYLFLTGGLIFGSIVFGNIFYYGEGPIILMMAAVAVIWLIAFLDVFSAFKIMNEEEIIEENNMEEGLNMEKRKRENKRIITLALSVIPGAGHMYMGYQDRGLMFMAGFFFTIFFMGWLNLNFLVFILPLIWFYSFFDSYHILNDKEIEDFDLSGILPKISQRYIGIGFIVIGLLVMFQNMIYPLLSQIFEYWVISYLQTTIVSILLILGGIKILKGKRNIEDEESLMIQEYEEEREKYEE